MLKTIFQFPASSRVIGIFPALMTETFEVDLVHSPTVLRRLPWPADRKNDHRMAGRSDDDEVTSRAENLADLWVNCRRHESVNIYPAFFFEYFLQLFRVHFFKPFKSR